MREIKFRAWDKKTEKIYNVNFIYFGAEVVALEDEFGEGKTFNRTFNDIELQQFTGLKDKNGKDIYFSDIVKYKDESGTGQIGIVKDYDYFSGYIEAVSGDDEGNQDLQLHPDYTQDWEVIGNIFENPELLN